MFGTGSLTSNERVFNRNCIDNPESIRKFWPNLVTSDGDGANYDKTVYCGIFELVENDLWFGMNFIFDNDQRLQMKIFYSDGQKLVAQTVLGKMEDILLEKDKDGLFG